MKTRLAFWIQSLLLKHWILNAKWLIAYAQGHCQGFWGPWKEILLGLKIPGSAPALSEQIQSQCHWSPRCKMHIGTLFVHHEGTFGARKSLNSFFLRLLFVCWVAVMMNRWLQCTCYTYIQQWQKHHLKNNINTDSLMLSNCPQGGTITLHVHIG